MQRDKLCAAKLGSAPAWGVGHQIRTIEITSKWYIFTLARALCNRDCEVAKHTHTSYWKAARMLRMRQLSGYSRLRLCLGCVATSIPRLTVYVGIIRCTECHCMYLGISISPSKHSSWCSVVWGSGLWLQVEDKQEACSHVWRWALVFWVAAWCRAAGPSFLSLLPESMMGN